MTLHEADRAEQIVDFIRAFREDHGYCPSVREIAIGVGLASTAAVHHHLVSLRDRGVIEFEPGTARSIRVMEV